MRLMWSVVLVPGSCVYPDVTNKMQVTLTISFVSPDTTSIISQLHVSTSFTAIFMELQTKIYN